MSNKTSESDPGCDIDALHETPVPHTHRPEASAQEPGKGFHCIPTQQTRSGVSLIGLERAP